MKIYCQPEDCDNCKYDDCVGIIKQKPGRKKMDPAVRRQHKLESARKYNAEHRERINQMNRENYRKKHAKKNS